MKPGKERRFEVQDEKIVESLISDAEKKLSIYKKDYDGMSWRGKVLLLVDIGTSLKILGINTNPKVSSVGSRERIRVYLMHHVQTVISAKELEVVSGVSEYGRRVRELRVQDGYKILTGHSNDPELGISLAPNEYFLLEIKPDKQAAHRWHIANRIRREAKGGSQGRLLRYLQENVNQIITSEELAYVAKASEFGRRVRELRTEEGFAIATKFTGRPDLGVGEYILESLERIAEPHDRKIPFVIQKEVYKRASQSCELCGWNHSRWKKKDPRILELHHLTEHAVGGKNSINNLISLCSKCHDEIHSGKRKLPA